MPEESKISKAQQKAVHKYVKNNYINREIYKYTKLNEKYNEKMNKINKKWLINLVDKMVKMVIIRLTKENVWNIKQNS